MDDYLLFCETLWEKWRANTLRDELSTFVRGQDRRGCDRFKLDSLPEPYYWIENGDRPLVALLTNPGDMMAHQSWSNVVKATGLSEDMLSHVLAKRKHLAIDTLADALARIGYALHIAPLPDAK